MTRNDFEEVLKKQFNFKTMPDDINIIPDIFKHGRTLFYCHWFNHPTLSNIDFEGVLKGDSVQFKQITSL